MIKMLQNNNNNETSGKNILSENIKISDLFFGKTLDFSKDMIPSKKSFNDDLKSSNEFNYGMKKSKSVKLKIPSFRREVSYIGRPEGFDLYRDLLNQENDEKDDFKIRIEEMPELSLPPTYEYVFGGQTEDVIEEKLNSNLSEHLDFTSIEPDTSPILGAIPRFGEDVERRVRAKKKLEEKDSESHMNRLRGNRLRGKNRIQQQLEENKSNSKKITKSPRRSGKKRPRAEAYTPEEMRAKVAHYRKKRLLRSFDKRILYKVRKDFADSRVRKRGRFVKQDSSK